MKFLPVGPVIRRRREVKPMSQVGLADVCGLSSQYISMLENGRNPSLDALSAIAEALECKVSEIILEAEERAEKGLFD
jgi:transcriptional regulator with XRE-family HTH domain